jgi:4-hydroxyphenylacetate 3-monooxygenase
MTTATTRLRLRTDSGVELPFAPSHLVVAGYTGRDLDTVRHHIEELAAIGVPEPDSIPAFYEIAVDRLITDATIVVEGTSTSGEVEPVLLRAGGRYYLTVGSDHTDRELERQGIQVAKAACPKPIAATVIDLGDDPTAVAWDDIVARSWVDGRAYQEGTLAQMLPASEVLGEWERSSAGGTTMALFGGTLPLLDGTFRYGTEWRMSLQVPDHIPLELTYSVTVRNS